MQPHQQSRPSILGTPLPPEGTDRERFIPEWKQEARDETGRKRFHGAFTGGFSAGYHNTVGSREGWTPASFTSSRSSRHAPPTSAQRVEDYMDEEDLRERRQDLHLVTTEQFAPAKAGAVVAKRGIGWQILRRMGWQGEERASTPLGQLLASCRRVSTRASGSEEQQEQQSSRHGARGGLGVGVLLEDKEDDLDVYAEEEARTSSKYNRSIELLPQTESAEYPGRAEAASVSGVLEGFVRSVRASLGLELVFAAPSVPPEYIPRGPFKDYDQQQESASAPEIKPASGPLSIQQRAALLGQEAVGQGQLADVVKLDVMTALAAQRGYMPFARNPAKDRRYRQFLAHFATSAAPPDRPEGMSETEYRREQEEFVKAANIYRPLPTTMASRFVSASEAHVMNTDLGQAEQPVGLYRPTPRPPESFSSRPDGEQAEEEEEKRKKKALLVDDSGPAAGPLAYGKDTRRETIWTPSSTLCKLFGIDGPHRVPPGARGQQSQSQQPSASVRPVLSTESLQKIVADSAYADKVDLGGAQEPEPANDDGEEEQELQPYETINRPAIELFRSIFGDESPADPGSGAPKEGASASGREGSATGRKVAMARPPRLAFLGLEEEGEGTTGLQQQQRQTPNRGQFHGAGGGEECAPAGQNSPPMVRIKKHRPAAADFWDGDA